MNWQPATRVDLIADSMNVSQFAKILRMIHFNDNSQIPTYPKDNNSCYKIQLIIDALKSTFKSIFHVEMYVSVDEQISPFKKKKSCLCRYLPKKLEKWGYKLWIMVGSSKFVYNFQVDGEEGCSGPPFSITPTSKCGESKYVVMWMSHGLPQISISLSWQLFQLSGTNMVL